MDNKKKEMRPVSVFKECWRRQTNYSRMYSKGGDIKEKIARQRGIKFATPL